MTLIFIPVLSLAELNLYNAMISDNFVQDIKNIINYFLKKPKLT